MQGVMSVTRRESNSKGASNSTADKQFTHGCMFRQQGKNSDERLNGNLFFPQEKKGSNKR